MNVKKQKTLTALSTVCFGLCLVALLLLPVFDKTAFSLTALIAPACLLTHCLLASKWPWAHLLPVVAFGVTLITGLVTVVAMLSLTMPELFLTALPFVLFSLLLWAVYGVLIFCALTRFQHVRLFRICAAALALFLAVSEIVSFVSLLSLQWVFPEEFPHRLTLGIIETAAQVFYAVGLLLWALWQRPIAAVKQNPHPLRVMTYNVQHCENYHQTGIDFEATAASIRHCAPDIVGLNEIRDKGTYADYEHQTAILSDLTGMEYFYFAKAIDVGGENPYGNALLSRIPILHAETVLIPDPDPDSKIGTVYKDYYETRCVLKAKLANGLTVLVTHFGLNPDEQQNAVDTVLKLLENEACVLMGDFNVTPDDAVLSPIRARMKDAADLFATPLLSFPSDTPDRKIDYLFVSPDLTVTAADIPAIETSDHRPHTATIQLP